jgi:hypothetical protein
MLISVQHDDSVGEDVNSIVVGNAFWLRHFEIFLGELGQNSLDQG